MYLTFLFYHFYALNYINDYKVNDSLYLKINAAYKGGLFV